MSNLSNFTLRVDVTHNAGAEGSESLGVQNDGMAQCFQ